MSDGRILVAGETSSWNFATSFGTPTPAPDQAVHHAQQAQGAQPPPHTFDGYVAILNAEMTQVERWTYFGGFRQDRAYFAMEDGNNDIWVCGFTESVRSGSGSPPAPSSGTANLYGAMGGSDVFVLRYNATLSDLAVLTRIGDTGTDGARATLFVDNVELAVYVSGVTTSLNFPAFVPGPGPQPSGADPNIGQPSAVLCASGLPSPGTCDYCLKPRNDDAYVVRLNRLNGQLVWSRVLGGSGSDYAFANVRVDPVTRDVFIGGGTRSPFIDPAPSSSAMLDPTYDITQPTYGARSGESDGWIAKLDNDDARVIGFAYYGGSGSDWVGVNDCLEVDAQGRVVIIGDTRSPDLPLAGQPLNDTHSLAAPDDCDGIASDIFIARFPGDLTTPNYGSYLNQAPGSTLKAVRREEASGLALYGGSIYITGETDSPGFPVTASAFDSNISAAHTEYETCPHPSCTTPAIDDFRDAFLVRVFPGISSASMLQYGTFFGGDIATATSTNEAGNRGRSLSVFTSGARAGQALFSGMTTAADFTLLTTPGVVRPAYPMNDVREGFVAIHDVF